MPRTKSAPKSKAAENYQHPEATSPMRPEVGTQAQFKKKKAPQIYRYDSSLSPALDWDGQNPAREQGEALLGEARSQTSEVRKRLTELKSIKPAGLSEAEFKALKKQIADVESVASAGLTALDKLKALSKPFLNWAGKAERLSFDVPTLPLFVHERLSTKAIIETLKGHKTDKQEDFVANLFADPRHSVTDQVLRAYEYKDNWVNRLILGDSLVAMNSLLHYESLGGQVQMLYMDPPYGVKFGSNFQPFVRKREVAHNDDEDMTREPEMVQAYRDTWELGLHSYLTYMRDRLLLARDLLTTSGSIFVQISDENLHHVRELMDEIYGPENVCCVIAFQKTGGFAPTLLSSVYDYILWYAKDKQLFRPRPSEMVESGYTWIELATGERRRLTSGEISDEEPMPKGRRFQSSILVSAGGSEKGSLPFMFQGQEFKPAAGTHWKTSVEGLAELANQNRLIAVKNTLAYVRYEDDFPVTEFNNVWDDTVRSTFSAEKLYVVQTSEKFAHRDVVVGDQPRAAGAGPATGSHRNLSVLRVERRGARTGRRVCVQAQAEQQGRGGRRDRAARDVEEHRQ